MAEMLLNVQQATLEAIAQLQTGQEKIITLLSQPSIEKAVQDMLKG